jgi:hypothetical protein
VTRWMSSWGSDAEGEIPPAVRDYLRELRKESRGVPRRAEILREIREHIGAGLAELDPTDDESVQYYLDQMGDPHEIMAQAGAKGHRTKVVKLAVASVGLVVGGGVVFGVSSSHNPGTRERNWIAVPRLVGLTEASAESLVSKSGLESTLMHVSMAPRTKGAQIVVRQSPSPGSKVSGDSKVTIYFTSP